MAATIELDLSGLKCPLPVLHMRRALRRLASGDRLVVVSTDPLATLDIPNALREDGHVLEDQVASDGRAIFRVLKQS